MGASEGRKKRGAFSCGARSWTSQACRQTSRAERRVVGLYPEGKDPDSPPSPSFAGSVFPLFTSRQSQDMLLSLFARSLPSPFSCSVVRMKLNATQSLPSSLLFSFFEMCGLPKLFPLSFTPSLCSQATTQLKWFAAAKKISLFSSHSPAAPPSCPLSLARSLPPSSLAVCV